MNSFSHLHVHSYYSINDSLTSLEDLFSCAERFEQKAIALTDNNLSGIPAFLSLSKSFPEIKPIVGYEINITDHYDCHLRDLEHRKTYKVVLLAKNYNGYLNLCKISTEAEYSRYMGEPRIDHRFLESHRDGLICLAAFTGGEISENILRGDIAGAKEAIEWYKNCFKQDFYLETSLYLDDESSRQIADGLFALSAETGIKAIASSDVRFTYKEQAQVYACLCSLKNNDFVKNSRYGQYYIRSTEEMLSLYAKHTEAIYHTQEIVDKVERFDIEQSFNVPIFQIPEGYESSFDYLKHITECALLNRYDNNVPSIATERLSYELDVVKEKGCADFFLHYFEFVSWAKENGILVSPGRASSAGWLINWLLGITEPNPIDYHLLSERFYNKDSARIPDIDIEVENGAQKRLIEHLEDRFGKDNVSRIISFGYYGAETSIKNASRALGLPIEDMVKLTKHIPEKILVSKDGLNQLPLKVTIKNCLKYDVDFKQFYNRCRGQKKQTIDVASELEGKTGVIGLHRSAILITDDTSKYSFPKMKIYDESLTDRLTCVASQYDRHNSEIYGAVLIDVVEDPDLSQIKQCIALIKEHHGLNIDISKIPLDDIETLNMFRNGEIEGIPQFDSQEMKTWLTALKPDCFEDITALYALSRPGMTDLVSEFIRRKHNSNTADEDKVTRAILSDTYGMIVYQEQIMSILQDIARFSPEETDHVRRLFGKKAKGELSEQHLKFIDRGREQWHARVILENIWEAMELKGTKVFCRAYAVSRCLTIWRMAYLKAHWPKIYKFYTTARTP